MIINCEAFSCAFGVRLIYGDPTQQATQRDTGAALNPLMQPGGVLPLINSQSDDQDCPEDVSSQWGHAVCVCTLCHRPRKTCGDAVERKHSSRALLDSKTSSKLRYDGVSLLHLAADQGHAGCVRALCKAGAAVNQMMAQNATALQYASSKGHVSCVRVLCEARAMLHLVANNGMTSLHLAAHRGHHVCVRVLCEARADVNQRTREANRPIDGAIFWDHAECVNALLEAGASMKQPEGCISLLQTACVLGNTSSAQVLSSHGARDELAIESAREREDFELANWLKRARDWTPLHHLEVLSPLRTLALLRGGADLHEGTPSPLERAQTVPGEASALVVRAGERWSPETHHLFPAATRARASAILRLGYLLAWTPLCSGEVGSLVDVWVHYVLPHVVVR